MSSKWNKFKNYCWLWTRSINIIKSYCRCKCIYWWRFS